MSIKKLMMKIKGIKTNKDKFTKKRIIITLLVLFFVLLISLGGLYIYVRSQIYSPQKDISDIKKDNLGDDNSGDGDLGEVNYQEVEGITNILLIGVDARDLNEKARSDSMIIATIDANNKKLKLTSIMRDSYVDIYNHKTQKINAAYAFGGPELLMDTIQRNFKIKLDKYVVINFWGFEDVIDLLGGIDVEVKDYEIDEINKYIGEVREEKSSPLTIAGMQHLDGQQALAYARIRKVGNGAYERDSRQREVIGLLVEKLKKTNVLQYANLMKKILPSIKTNIEPINFLNYAYTVSKFNPITVEGLQVPLNELSSGQIYMDTWVLLMDKDQNAAALNDFIFKDKKVDPKQLDLKAFQAKINEYLKKDADLKPAKSDSHVDSSDGDLEKLPIATPTPTPKSTPTPVPTATLAPVSTPTATIAPTPTPIAPVASPTPVPTVESPTPTIVPTAQTTGPTSTPLTAQ